MKKNNPALKQVLALCFSVMLFSCNNNAENKEEPGKTGDSSASTTTTIIY